MILFCFVLFCGLAKLGLTREIENNGPIKYRRGEGDGEGEGERRGFGTNKSI